MVLSFILPFAVISASFFIFQATFNSAGIEHMRVYQLCFLSFLAISVCIETRVRMGYRLARGPIFWIHLPTALLFFGLLATLAVIPLPRWTEFVAFGLFLVVLSTGLILFYKGIHQTFRTNRASS